MPIDQIDRGARSVVPVCRELTIPKDRASVFLDLFGFTGTGRPVLIDTAPSHSKIYRSVFLSNASMHMAGNLK